MELATFDLSPEALIGSLLALGALFVFCRSLLVEDVICIPGKSKHGWKSIKILDRVSKHGNAEVMRQNLICCFYPSPLPIHD